MIYIIENFLSPSQCTEVVTACRVGGVQEASLTGRKYDYDHRRCHTKLFGRKELSEHSQITAELVERYDCVMDTYGLELFPQYTLTNVRFQFTKYDSAQHHFFNYHKDDPKSLNPRRLISSTVQLSRYSDYEGGELQFRDYQIDHFGEWRKQGNLILFDSQLYHRVTPVTAGLRFSFVSWHAGPAPI